ncbi:MAG: hypothetical protein HY328_19665 [Chloroflexi bacterium]|nr:hypothetical protein [Chloroflexota bacterium]
MVANERLHQIETAYGNDAERIVLVEQDEEALRLILFLRDGSNLRVAEQWNGSQLIRYSYYWLTSDNRLITGWDNAAHHRHLPTYPHHKHIGQQANVQPSQEINLDAVMAVILRGASARLMTSKGFV